MVFSHIHIGHMQIYMPILLTNFSKLLVVAQYKSGANDLYISDTSGHYYSPSLSDLYFTFLNATQRLVFDVVDIDVSTSYWIYSYNICPILVNYMCLCMVHGIILMSDVHETNRAGRLKVGICYH